jgi:hypothetical protein
MLSILVQSSSAYLKEEILNSFSRGLHKKDNTDCCKINQENQLQTLADYGLEALCNSGLLPVFGLLSGGSCFKGERRGRLKWKKSARKDSSGR